MVSNLGCTSREESYIVAIVHRGVGGCSIRGLAAVIPTSADSVAAVHRAGSCCVDSAVVVLMDEAVSDLLDF